MKAKSSKANSPEEIEERIAFLESLESKPSKSSDASSSKGKEKGNEERRTNLSPSFPSKSSKACSMKGKQWLQKKMASEDSGAITADCFENTECRIRSMDSEDRDASGTDSLECSVAMESKEDAPLIRKQESRELNDDRLNEQRLVKLTLCLVLGLVLVLVLVGLAVGGIVLVSGLKISWSQNSYKTLTQRLETVNGSKDIDEDMIRRIASSILHQLSVKCSDSEAPHISTLLPFRPAAVTTTTTATPTTPTVTTTKTATPTTYKHWDWKTNCGVKPLNDTGYFGVWPWQVLLREMKFMGKNDWEIQNKCGGVLISSKFVLTAAHCQATANFSVGMGVVLGFVVTKNYGPRFEVTYYVEDVFVHPDYVAGTFDNDLALIELTTPVPFQEHILPICLPNEENDYARSVATVAGWGSPRHGDSLTEKLQEVQLHIITNSDCQVWFQEKNITKDITPELMCAGYRNSCEGDSGGPLTLRGPDGRWVLVGAVSQGIKCAKPILPGVYMRMSHYLPWIESIINA